MMQRFPGLVVGLFFLVLLGTNAPTRASIIVQSAGVGGSVLFSGDVTEELVLRTNELGHQFDRLDFAAQGASAVLRYDMTTPETAGTGFAVSNLVRAHVPLDQGIQAVISAAFHIDWLVETTQGFWLFGVDANFGHGLEGFITFQDRTTGTIFFSILFGDFQGGGIGKITLEGGHVYSLSANGEGSADDIFGDNTVGEAFTFRLNAVPEPSTLALAAIGGVGLLGYGWRRRRRA